MAFRRRRRSTPSAVGRRKRYPINFGAKGPNEVQYLQVIAYKGAVSDPQMTGLEAYLATKYGL